MLDVHEQPLTGSPVHTHRSSVFTLELCAPAPWSLPEEGDVADASAAPIGHSMSIFSDDGAV